MTPQQAKDLLPIITAFAQGKTVQYQTRDGWMDAIDLSFIFNPEKYRIKPDPISLKYRRYIWKDNQGLFVASFAQNSQTCVENVENMPCFVRWIDNDWITYECEV